MWSEQHTSILSALCNVLTPLPFKTAIYIFICQTFLILHFYIHASSRIWILQLCNEGRIPSCTLKSKLVIYSILLYTNPSHIPFLHMLFLHLWLCRTLDCWTMWASTPVSGSSVGRPSESCPSSPQTETSASCPTTSALRSEDRNSLF